MPPRNLRRAITGTAAATKSCLTSPENRKSPLSEFIPKGVKSLKSNLLYSPFIHTVYSCYLRICNSQRDQKNLSDAPSVRRPRVRSRPGSLRNGPEQTNKRLNRQTYERADKRTAGPANKRPRRQTGRRTGGRTEEWADGPAGGRPRKQTGRRPSAGPNAGHPLRRPDTPHAGRTAESFSSRLHSRKVRRAEFRGNNDGYSALNDYFCGKSHEKPHNHAPLQTLEQHHRLGRIRRRGADLSDDDGTLVEPMGLLGVHRHLL